MAELATIARPYAEALYEVAPGADVGAQLAALAGLTADEQLRRFADNPKVDTAQVFGVIGDVLGSKGIQLLPALQNLLRTVLDNGRLAALPEIAAQYHALANAGSGVADVQIESAFPLDDAQLAEVLAVLQRRFGRRLEPQVTVRPDLIGGIRAVVGDEVLDTSVKARLEQMKVALTA